MLPVFVGFFARGDEARGWRLANAIVTLAMSGFLALAGVCFLLAPWLMATVIAPGLAGEQLELAIELTRLLVSQVKAILPTSRTLITITQPFGETSSRKPTAVAPMMYA